MSAIQLRLECKFGLSRKGVGKQAMSLSHRSGRVEAGLSRINNFTESWHSAFNKILIKHPFIC